MKTRILTLLLIIVVAFTACDLSNDSNYTPGIFFVQNPINNHQDTLKGLYTDVQGTLLLDTIQTGDTVVFYLYLEGYTNRLRTFMLTNTPDSAAKIILPNVHSMDSIFADNSEYNKGKFYLDGSQTSLYFPFKYVALKPSSEAKINFLIISDAVFDTGFGSNTASMTLKTPIRN